MTPKVMSPLALALVLSSQGALAQTLQDRPAAASTVPPPDAAPESSTEPALIPAAQDTLGGHFKLGVSGLVAIPFADLDSDRAFRDKARTGFGAAADLGFGISRSVVVGLYGQYVSFDAADECPACDPKSFGVGAFVRYHLVQGVRFDPWASLGAGYRYLDSGENKYSGIEWLRLAVGGDWYALSQFAFGPYLELNFGSFLRTPAGSDPAVYATATGGIRLSLDFPGK